MFSGVWSLMLFGIQSEIMCKIPDHETSGWSALHCHMLYNCDVFTRFADRYTLEKRALQSYDLGIFLDTYIHAYN